MPELSELYLVVLLILVVVLGAVITINSAHTYEEEYRRCLAQHEKEFCDRVVAV